MNLKLQKWIRWLGVAKDEIQDLVIAKYTFHEIQTMILNNPQIQRNSSFYGYLSSTYASHVVMSIRRQIKSDPQGVSMVRLFAEMIAAPETFDRAYYTDQYRGSLVENMTDRDFDNFAEHGAPHISSDLVSKDLARLETASMRCEDFADKRLAHRDKRELKDLPTFNEVDSCIDLLDKLYVKYHSLFHAEAMDSLLPTLQYDWMSIFRVPWLPPEDEQ